MTTHQLHRLEINKDTLVAIAQNIEAIACETSDVQLLKSANLIGRAVEGLQEVFELERLGATE